MHGIIGRQAKIKLCTHICIYIHMYVQTLHERREKHEENASNHRSISFVNNFSVRPISLCCNNVSSSPHPQKGIVYDEESTRALHVKWISREPRRDGIAFETHLRGSGPINAASYPDRDDDRERGVRAHVAERKRCVPRYNGPLECI